MSDINGQGEGDDTDNFEAAFNSLAEGEPPAKAGEDQGEAEPAPAEGEEPPANDTGADEAPEASSDIWASASPELIAERDRLLQAERDKVAHATASDRGRIAALQRQLQGRGQPHTPPAEAEPSETEEEKTEREERAERIKRMREDYPDLAAPILDLLDEQAKKLDRLTPTVTAVENDRDAAFEAEQEEALAAIHPDWKDLCKDANFAGWLSAQPASIQKIATDSLDARETSMVLTVFKAERAAAMQADPSKDDKPDNKPDARRQRQLDGNRMPGSRAAPAPSGAPGDFEGGFEHFAAKKKVASAR